MKTPNLFILGAPKCGTTSLAVWLSEHPDVFVSAIKEPNFFNTDMPAVIRYSEKEYKKIFSLASSDHIWLCDASTGYLSSEVAIQNIIDYSERPQDIRYIVAIRNPMEMAVSLHSQRLREGTEIIKDFGEAWHKQSIRAKGKSIPAFSDRKKLMYGPLCYLGDQIRRLFDQVDREQVHVVVLDDIKEDSRGEYFRILDFLELPDDNRESFPVYNQAWAIPPWVAKIERAILLLKDKFAIRKGLGIIRSINKRLSISGGKSSLSKSMTNGLIRYFEQDVDLLSELLERDFSYWLRSDNIID